MDIRQFCDEMWHLYQAAKPDTNLKLLHKIAGLSQQQLTELSGVSARTIQQYEQRQKKHQQGKRQASISNIPRLMLRYGIAA